MAYTDEALSMTQPVINATLDHMAVRIREARLERGLTIAELARRMNVDARTVARWQAAERSTKPAYDRLVRLAEVLDKTPSYFLDGKRAA